MKTKQWKKNYVVVVQAGETTIPRPWRVRKGRDGKGRLVEGDMMVDAMDLLMWFSGLRLYCERKKERLVSILDFLFLFIETGRVQSKLGFNPATQKAKKNPPKGQYLVNWACTSCGFVHYYALSQKAHVSFKSHYLRCVKTRLYLMPRLVSRHTFQNYARNDVNNMSGLRLSFFLDEMSTL